MNALDALRQHSIVVDDIRRFDADARKLERLVASLLKGERAAA